MLQEYGDEEDWRKHFEYLLPFFQSPLYIKKNGQPVFLIHFTKHMEHIIEPMLIKWNEWARTEGIPGIYVIEVMSSQNKPYASSSSAILEFEPLHSAKNKVSLMLIPMVVKYVFNRLWKRIFHE